jgi:DNA-binding GntR family transcriptional regulator
MLLRDSVYQMIHQAIVTCEFEPGQELREQVLAERYRVSRSPVRDALLRLELESLVTVLPRQGYLVNAIRLPDVESMFDLRLLVTSACAARAAHASDRAVQTLDQFRAGPVSSADEDAYLDYNRAFHYGITDICGNVRLAAIEHDLVEHSCRLVRISLRYRQNDTVQDAISEHNAIINAIQAHDAQTASRLSHHHVMLGHGRILAVLRKSLGAEAGSTNP